MGMQNFSIRVEGPARISIGNVVFEGTMENQGDGKWSFKTTKKIMDWNDLLAIPPVADRRPSTPEHTASFDERLHGTPHPFEDLIFVWDSVVARQAELVAAHAGARCLNTYTLQRPCPVCRDNFENTWAWYQNVLVVADLEDQWKSINKRLETERHRAWLNSEAGTRFMETIPMDEDYEEHTYFIGPCTCEHEPEEHGWGSCDQPGCDCEAGWEE